MQSLDVLHNKIVRMENFVRRNTALFAPARENIFDECLRLMKVTRWKQEDLPALDALRQELGREGFRVSEWTDAPGTVYPVHQHDETEVRWIVRGQLRVGLPEQGQEIVLEAGDRLELDPNEMYWADVEAAQPVMYLIGIKNGHKKENDHRAPADARKGRR